MPMRWIVVLALGSAACARPAPTAPVASAPSPAERAAAEEFIAWVDNKSQLSCTCRDFRCAGRVSGQVTAWALTRFGEFRFDEQQRRRLHTISERIEGCEDAMFARERRASERVTDLAITELEELDAEMCACTDVACVRRVSAKFDALLEVQTKHRVGTAKFEKANAIVKHLVECATRTTENSP